MDQMGKMICPNVSLMLGQRTNIVLDISCLLNSDALQRVIDFFWLVVSNCLMATGLWLGTTDLVREGKMHVSAGFKGVVHRIQTAGHICTQKAPIL